jgi:hypothetical protein
VVGAPVAASDVDELKKSLELLQAQLEETKLEKEEAALDHEEAEAKLLDAQAQIAAALKTEKLLKVPPFLLLGCT